MSSYYTTMYDQFKVGNVWENNFHSQAQMAISEKFHKDC